MLPKINEAMNISISRYFTISAALFLLILLSCSNGKSPEGGRKPTRTATLQLVKIVEPLNGSLFARGDVINVEITLLGDTIKPDSVILFVDSERISRFEGVKSSLGTEQFPLGTRQIRATAWLNGERQTASVGIKLKSDIAPKKLMYRVINTFPHDPQAYTQGLFYYDGYLIESTGQKGQSSLRRVELKTGKVVQSANLDNQYFGEGASLINGKIFQLTWTSRKGFVYDPKTFALIRTFDYMTQGWGLTTVDDKLVMSDGSNILYFLEPESFTEIKRIEVMDNNGPVFQLNELEFINGKIWANVYQTDKIVIIDHSSGAVEAEVDFSGLLKDADKHRNIDVFNGIAWDEKGNRLFVTGKNWPKLFEVDVK